MVLMWTIESTTEHLVQGEPKGVRAVVRRRNLRLRHERLPQRSGA